jgi:hypothetical protein
MRVHVRAYHVFNTAQVDGYQEKPESLLPETERIGDVDAFFNSLRHDPARKGSGSLIDKASSGVPIPGPNGRLSYDQRCPEFGSFGSETHNRAHIAKRGRSTAGGATPMTVMVAPLN